MKKTIRVNINGIVFNLDDDAYYSLEKYLKELEKKFSSTEEGREILSDVEARIAELMQQRLGKEREVNNISDIHYIIEILGTPDDFGDETNQNVHSTNFSEKDNDKSESKSHSVESEQFTQQKKYKRLYRDSDNIIIGGVCGGIGAYLNIDPLIIRILFVIITILGAGFTILIYIILWFVLPKAETATQKLEMRGQKVNLSNIERTIRDEFNDVKSNFQNFKHSEKFEPIRQGMHDSFNSVINALAFVLKIFVKFLGIAFIIGSIAGIIALFVQFVWKTGITGEFTDDVFGSAQILCSALVSPTQMFVASLGMCLVSFIPIILILFAGLKMTFRFKSRNKLILSSMLIAWLFGLFIIITLTVSKVKDFSSSENEIILHDIASTSDTLSLTLKNTSFDYESPENKQFRFKNLKIVNINGEPVLYGKPKVSILKSETGKFELAIKRSAYGEDRFEARSNAQKINYLFDQQVNKIALSGYFTLPQHRDYWRKQQLEIIIYVPENKTVFLDESLDDLIYDIQNVNNYWDFEMLGKYWVMKPEGLTLSGVDNIHRGELEEFEEFEENEIKIEEIDDNLDHFEKNIEDFGRNIEDFGKNMENFGKDLEKEIKSIENKVDEDMETIDIDELKKEVKN